ncbi:unnamed protein product [Mycena citricolor]|uniref:NADH dehydrogenase [ubiquinone] 1 alpha subcomplex subunit 11 n=1 Tax=Mycena citricolor TaxID=2018698 RepID=A0AAD2HR05_9AGAR|nr:unnamed protein product [Mycena citricolor]
MSNSEESNARLQELIQKVVTTVKEKPANSVAAPGTYEAKSSVENAFRLGGQSAIVGTIAAGLRNTLAGKNAGIILPIGLFTAVGATYAFTEATVANAREVDDSINSAAGACAAGFLLGLSQRSLPMAVGTCSVMGSFAYLQQYTKTDGHGVKKPDAEKSFFKSSSPFDDVKV